MKWFEKEYKERFENESTYDGVDSQMLWDEISMAIPQKGQPKKTPFWRWIFIAGILIGAFSTYIFISISSSEKNKDLSDNQTENNTNLLSKITDVNIDKDFNDEKLQSNTTTTTNLSFQKSTLNSSNLPFDKLPPEIFNESDNKTKTKIANNISSSNSYISKEKNNNNNLSNIMTGGVENTTNKNIQSHKRSKKSTSKLRYESNKTNDVKSDKAPAIGNYIKDRNFQQIVKILSPECNLNSDPRIIKSTIATIPKVNVSSKNPWTIGIEAGVSFFNLNYNDDQNMELFADNANNAKGPLQLGNYILVKIEYELNPNWSVISGLGLSNLEHKLSTVFTLDTTILDSSQVLRNAQSIRTIKHHNKLSIIKIPIALSYQYSLAKGLTLGTSIGVSYSVVSGQRGRVLGRSHTILDYSNNENRQFENFLSLNFNPFIRYGLSSKLTLELNTGISFQNHTNSLVQELKQSSTIYNIGLGLNYKL